MFEILFWFCLAMDLPEMPQLINLDLSEDKIVCVDAVVGDVSSLDKTLQEADFGDFFR